jgi:hypothetical protein
MKEWLSLITSTDRIKTEILVALASSCLFLLLSPSWVLHAIGLLNVATLIKNWLGITLMLSLFLLVARAAGLSIRSASRQLKRLHAKQMIHQLTGEELGFLGEFIERDVATLQAPVGDGLTGSLLAKGLIFRASSLGNVLSGFPYGIQPWVKTYLQKRSYLWAEHTSARGRQSNEFRGR